MSRKVYDLNRLRKTYPLRRKRPNYAVIDDSLTENIILSFDNTSNFPYTYTFENQYQSVPVCIATAENVKVNVFIKTITVNQVELDISGRVPGDQSLKIHLQIFRNQDPS